MTDPFDQHWQWAQKPTDDQSTIPAELHHAATSMSEEQRNNCRDFLERYRDYLIGELGRRSSPTEVNRLNDEHQKVSYMLASEP